MALPISILWPVNETYLANPRLIPLPRNPDRNRLVHLARPHNDSNNLMVLVHLLDRLPLAPLQHRGFNVLQQLRPDVVRQDSLDQAVGLGEGVAALGEREGRLVRGVGCARGCWRICGLCGLGLGARLRRGVQASSAGVSLCLLGDLRAGEGPDGQGEGAGAHCEVRLGALRMLSRKDERGVVVVRQLLSIPPKI